MEFRQVKTFIYINSFLAHWHNLQGWFSEVQSVLLKALFNTLMIDVDLHGQCLASVINSTSKDKALSLQMAIRSRSYSLKQIAVSCVMDSPEIRQ